MELGLKGKTALVTGAGRGIGRGIALRLAQEGANLAVNDIDESAAEAVVVEIQDAGNRGVSAPADISSAAQVDEMVALVTRSFEMVDILVNNAGFVWSSGGPITRPRFATSTPEQWQKEVDLILYGMMHCTKAVVGQMIEKKGGRIVNIASDAGRAGGFSRLSVYSMAKGGVIAFTRSIATELAPYNITVNAVSPGYVRTSGAIIAEGLESTDPEAYQRYREFENRMLNNIPIGRIGQPGDIAAMTAFLASDLASYITGQTIGVNGGLIMT